MLGGASIRATEIWKVPRLDHCPMTKRSRRFLSGSFLALLVAVAGIAYLLRSPGNTGLLQKGTRVFPTTTWVYSGRPTYDWLSDNELLYYRQEVKGGTNFFVPVRFDLNSQTESRLGVARIFSTYRGYGVPFRTELSPDRQSLLWWGNYGHTYLGRLDGSSFRSWKGWESETHW